MSRVKLFEDDGGFLVFLPNFVKLTTAKQYFHKMWSWWNNNILEKSREAIRNTCLISMLELLI